MVSYPKVHTGEDIPHIPEAFFQIKAVQDGSHTTINLIGCPIDIELDGVMILDTNELSGLAEMLTDSRA